jgi:hypothetical protein
MSKRKDRRAAKNPATPSDSKESAMIDSIKQTVTLYVDRSSEKWIARDPDGNYWLVPSTNDGWNRREPFAMTEDTQLERVPGHYRYTLGIPL